LTGTIQLTGIRSDLSHRLGVRRRCRRRKGGLALGCFNRHGKSTRTTTCSRRIQRRTPGAATTAHGGGRRAAAQVQRTCKGATKHRDVHKAHQGAPHLHAVRLVGSRRRRGSKRRPARVCAATALKLRVWDERGGATGGWRPLNRPGTVARRAGHGQAARGSDSSAGPGPSSTLARSARRAG
jgi:hypothetical protein